MKTFPIEQSVRTLVDEQLKNLGWRLANGKRCNVFQEQPRTIKERKKLKGKRPDYVLYSKDSNRIEPLVIIETKKPGSNLDEALKQGNIYAEELGAPIVFATDGIYYKTLHTKKEKPLFLNGEEVDELIRELEAIKFLENNEVNTISEEVIYDRKQLIKIFEESNNLLRDEGFRAGIERFGEFSNILFLKLIGELEDLKEEEGRSDEIILDKSLRWSQWKNKTGKELLYFVNDTVLKNIGEAYNDKDIFTKLQIKNPETLKKIIDKLDPLNLINIDSDIKGDSFEYFLKQSTATKNDLGEYFTPRHIVKVMVKLLNPQIGETIYDPFCGTGGTLIETFKHISHNMARTKSNWERLREKTLFGNEITTTARITKMNMILIGDGHSGIQQKNSLKNPVNDKYDVVITNMPYSQKTEYGSYYDLPTNNGDSICIQHCIKAIDKTSENGRMALIVPEGFLFRKDLQKTREYLLDRCVLKSIISLPQGVFLPYTGVKTNILYCTNVKQKKKQDKFWYFDVKNDGYSLDNHRRKLEGKTDLQKFLEYRNTEIQDKKNILQVGFSQISMDNVKENDLVLVGSRYKKMFDYQNIEWELVEIFDVANVGAGNSAPQKQEYFKNGTYPFFRTSDVAVPHITTNLITSRDKLNKEGIKNLRLVLKDTILMPKSGASTFLNHRSILGVDGFVSSHLATIEVNKEKILPKFLFYILCEIDAKKLTINQNYPSLKLSDIGNFKFPLPPIEMQKEIVKELDSYKNVIDGARQIVENYKPHIEIKDEWIYKDLNEVSNIVMGQSPDGKFYNINKKGLPFYQGKTEFGDVYLKNPKKWTSHSTKEANKKNILMSIRAPVGPVNLSSEKICIGRGLCAIQPKKELNYLFLFYYLQNIQEQISRFSTGSTFSAINKNDVEKIQIPLPTIKEQEKIVNQILDEIEIVTSSKKAIKTFENKIKEKLDFIWGK
jgi:type I restriction enzyme M protein